MVRPAGRILLLLLTVAVTAGVVWRATTNEQERGRERTASQRVDAAAADTISALADLRASLHAALAPGQGADYWAERANAQLDDIEARLTALEPGAAAANHSLAPAIETFASLRARARQALGQAQAGQPEAAGRIIFSEARDLIDQVAQGLSDARQSMARAASSREGGRANEQSLLAGALISVWIVVLILLVPVPAARPPNPTADPRSSPAPTPAAPSESLPLNSPPPAPPEPVAPAATPATPIALPVEPSVEPPPSPTATPPAAAEPAATPLFQSLAALCLDLGRVDDAGALEPLLARTAEMMSARGVVVWLMNEAAGGLVPAVAHGYDLEALAQVGALALDDGNLTSTAFRTGTAMVSAAAPDHAAAVAVPIVAASGTVGVLAAEVDAAGDLERVTAIGGVVAAQLANLFQAPADAA